ncbi:MAG TPA: DUF4430 domain-containing protein [Gaiellaceae bacterium]|nr:DUF4430 domain-containing protein [Gaiellaceae bacterium]
MRHRPLVLLGVSLLALALAAPALAVRVHVRVEGARATLFGPTEPFVTPVTGAWAPPAGAAVALDAATPLGALEAASRRGELFYRLESFSFGPYVAQIGRLSGTETTGWVYKVNGVSPPVGAHAHELREGDHVLWYHATFGAAGGPRTLALQRRTPVRSRRGVRCFRALSVDDNGRRAVERDVVFRVDDRAVRSRSGRICLRGHWHAVRATKPGFVRSRVATAPR